MANVLNDKYELIEVLGAPVGDFDGVAIKAREIVSAGSGRVVLLRQIPADAAVPSIREAASRASTISRHPNILEFYGLTKLPGAPSIPAGAYVVSEYVRGISLRERIRRIAPFSLVVAIDIAVAIAQAAQFAAEKGVAHGHLCAEQVILTPEGQIRVADFALAQAIHDASHSGHDVPGSDVKALGLLLFEMLTGVAPGTTADEASPRESNSNVPPAVDGIVRKALASNPRTKYPSMAALLSDLLNAREDIKNGKPLTWTPQTSTQQRPASGLLSQAADEIAREEKSANVAEVVYDESQPGGTWLSKLVAILFVVVVLGILAAVFLAARMLTVPADTVVPNMVGKSYSDAQQIAKSNHFNLVVEKHDYSDTWPTNTVMSQDVIEGRQIKSGKDVGVEISDGPPLSTVPDLTQVTTARAKQMILGAGLPVGTVTPQYNDVVPVGIVTGQDPPPNANVSHKTPVNITVSKGPSPPPTPTGLSASATVQGEIDLSWNEVATASSYNVYRDGKKLVSGLAQSGYSDVRLGASETHNYSVTAVNVNGESAQSEQVSSTTLTDTGVPVDQTAPPPVSAAPPAPAPSSTSATGSAGSSAAGPRQRQFHIHFRVPHGGTQHNVQIEIQDATGTNVVYDEVREPGQVIDQTFSAFGNKVIIRIYLDGKLVKQQIK
ncbi:MAG: PASTA domain-containing protein [Capsulimonadaceae bacterium]|nr:PASTA domain-containing protein [Capsulimonadaceae bacterium]